MQKAAEKVNMKLAMKKPPSCISGSALKLLAMGTMLIDHSAHFILKDFPFCTRVWFTLVGQDISFYFICRMIGRLAFPLFCFLMVEGFLYTKNRKKYGGRLLLFALLSELPWNFAHSGTWLYPTQNVMFTLFFGYLALCALEFFEQEKGKQLIALVILFVVCLIFKIDYSVRGLGLILIMYLLREKPAPRAIVSSCILSSGWAAGFAFVPIHFYSGKRGFMKGAVLKYAAYLFYPVHLAILGLIQFIWL